MPSFRYVVRPSAIWVGNLCIWEEKDDVRLSCANAPCPPRDRMAVSRFHDRPDVYLFAEMNQIKDRVAVVQH